MSAFTLKNPAALAIAVLQLIERCEHQPGKGQNSGFLACWERVNY